MKGYAGTVGGDPPDFPPPPEEQKEKRLANGWHECLVMAGKLVTDMKDVPSYELTFLVLDGEHPKRMLQFTTHLSLTGTMLSASKRKLADLGVTTLEQLVTPLLPGRIRCKMYITACCDEYGEHYSEGDFEVLDISTLNADAPAGADTRKDSC